MLGAARDRWQDLKNGLWFFPTLVVAAFIALALALVGVDRGLPTDDAGLFFGGDASAARSVLTTVAGSLITVAGLTFSITIVVLQLASTQYSPRVLRTFLGDRITQVTVGIFVGLFVYCLLALRTVRGGEDGAEFVPSLAITVAIVLAVLALALLIVFINNIAKLVQAENIVERIAASLASATDERPEVSDDTDGSREAEELLRAWERAAASVEVYPDRSGYVQSIDVGQAARRLDSGEWRIQACVAPGDFVPAHAPLARFFPDGDTGDGAGRGVAAAFNIANQRDAEQDAAFAIRQLADIAIKAISPAINDPTTGATCVGYLRAGLVALAARRPPPAVRRIDGGRITFVMHVRRLRDDAAPLLELGREARATPRVAQAVLEALGDVVAAARASARGDEADEVAAAGKELAELLAESAELESDRRTVERLAARVEGRTVADARPG